MSTYEAVKEAFRLAHEQNQMIREVAKILAEKAQAKSISIGPEGRE